MAGHGHGGGRKKKVHHEEHVNHERWLVTYADMVTLLMVLFIVLFAISQVDQKKFMQLAQGLSTGFGGPVRVLQGSDGILPAASDASIVAFDPRATFNVRPEPGIDLKSDMSKAMSTVGGSTDARPSKQLQKALQENAKLDDAARQVIAGLKEAGYDQKVKFIRDERGLTITIITDKVVFPADSATLSGPGASIIDAVAKAVVGLPNQIAVEGHTNQAAVRPANFIDEWQLSTDRAGAVLRVLAKDGVRPDRLRAIGYGDTRPLYAVEDPRALDGNRRVDVVVLSDFAKGADVQPPSIASGPENRQALAGTKAPGQSVLIPREPPT